MMFVYFAITVSTVGITIAIYFLEAKLNRIEEKIDRIDAWLAEAHHV